MMWVVDELISDKIYDTATKSMTQIRDMSMTIYYSEQINIGISTKITSFKKRSWNVELNGGIFIHIACIEAQQLSNRPANSSISDILRPQMLQRHRCSTRMSRTKKQFRD